VKIKIILPIFLTITLFLFFQNCATNLFSGKSPNLNSNFSSSSEESVPSVAKKLSTGLSETTCTVRNGGVFCWGRNTNGQVGNNSTEDAIRPWGVIPEGSGATEVAVGGTNGACALVKGGVQCWGADTNGQSENSVSLKPRWIEAFPAGSGIEKIYRGNQAATACAQKEDQLWCWGNSRSGVILAHQDYVPQPTLISETPSQLDQVVIGKEVLCVTTKNKKIFCKGSNQSGQLGQGTVDMGSMAFVEVQNVDTTFKRLYTNGKVFCYNANSGVSCWGDHFLIKLTNGASFNGVDGFKKLNYLPMLISELGQDVQSMALGEFDICVVKRIGTMACLGQNFSGQLGNGEQGATLFQGQLVDVVGISKPMVHAVGGLGHVCAISNDERIFCWGSNFRGNLGVGIPNSTLSFSKLPLETNF
jgi:hypothetical protein